MMTIEKTSQFQQCCPRFKGAAILAKVTNKTTTLPLQQEIDKEIAHLRNIYTTATIKERSGIAATREAYRAFGKDPSRYRPACEQLARRAVQGKGLYPISTLVDLGNLLSLLSGYSIAVLDHDKIVGEQLELGVGTENEPYEAIGRGTLNIAHLPIYRDKTGGIATPTSDHVRTMISSTTSKVIILINAYDGDLKNLSDTIKTAQQLLINHAAGRELDVIYY